MPLELPLWLEPLALPWTEPLAPPWTEPLAPPWTEPLDDEPGDIGVAVELREGAL